MHETLTTQPSATLLKPAPPLTTLVTAIVEFKARMARVDRALVACLISEGDARGPVAGACNALHTALRQHVTREPERAAEIGALVVRETSALFMGSSNIERWFTKPRGYAGDYFTIELMYEACPRGAGRLGRLIDEWALGLPAARAVRNRRQLLAGAIHDTVAAHAPRGTTRITSLASGPARELFDVLTGPGAPPIAATCVDIDDEAIGWASARANELGVADRVTFSRDNVLRLSRGRGTTVLPPQHLIYSVGLIDYLADAHVVRLLDWIHDRLVPGGTVILGNFDVANPDRAFMDHVLDWRLIHRTADDMRRLFAASQFGDAPVTVRAEHEQVNLFAFCRREGEGHAARAA
jgi:extracellular factor (EF) 3-hydroxypalmitic acid methyl ester biosynthesis protein